MYKKIPYADLKGQYNESKLYIDKAIGEVIESHQYIHGKFTQELEDELKKYTGAEDCACVGSGSIAIECALKAGNILPGDEVITVSHTFVSTVEAIVNVGAIPVFVDIDEYYQIDVNKIENKITNKTKAILFVDLYGQTPNIDALKTISSKNNLLLIEDAAQSFGSEYKGKKIGSVVDITTFSFNPTKNLGAMGDAGAVVGPKDIIAKIKMYRDHGRGEKYAYDEIGYNARIDNLQARIVQAKLRYIDDWNKGRLKKAIRYNNKLKDYVKVPLINKDSLHTFYIYAIQTDQRDELKSYLNENGIGTNIHYKYPVHQTKAYEKYATNDLTISEEVCKKIISLPVYHTLSQSKQDYIIKKVIEFHK
jgi:dTDP-4-amino-4,6-dideoxygalactose transaminase